MKAAVITSFERPPVFTDIRTPIAAADEVLLQVQASALSPLVKVQASGKHYSSRSVPMVPGVDGVGTLPDGQRVYFAFPQQGGTLAQWVAVPKSNLVALADDLDSVTAAAIANPGMSSWAALTRAAFAPGETVLINGANGTSGRLAIQIAKHLGARRVIATARSHAHEAELRALGADEFIGLQQSTEQLHQAFQQALKQGVDVVLDYLWGAPAEALLNAAISTGSAQAAPRLRFINIGSLAGGNISLNANAIRSSGVELLGSGLGSLSHAALIESIAQLLAVVKSAKLQIATLSHPLNTVGDMWQQPTRERLVFTL